jgi:class 3 adenylate cyclase
VNQAARLSDLAKQTPGGVLVDARILALAPDERRHWTPNGDAELRGVATSVPVAVPAPTRLTRAEPEG